MLCAAFAGGAAQPKQAEAQVKWKTHRDAMMGFSLQHPLDWKLRADSVSGRVEIEGRAGERVVFWPLFLPNVELDGDRAAFVLKALRARLLPGLDWSEPISVAPSLLRAEGRPGTAWP
ncbi:MAG: hypothetical protein K6U03_09840 [Firmicutes bacterium]|nr:hypothetical protein [Bacillota bacterium]